jgi:protein O-GlcNAc transferase
MASLHLREQLLEAYGRDEPALTIELAQLCLAEELGDRSVFLMYGDALGRVARYPEALDAYHKALDLSSTTERTTVVRQLARLHDQWGKYAEAERCYRDVISDRPDHTSAYIYLGAMLARLGRLPEAEEIHRRATSCSEGEIGEAYLNLALVQRARRDYFGALTSLRSAVELDPDDAETKDALADIQRVLFEFPSVEA